MYNLIHVHPLSIVANYDLQAIPLSTDEDFKSLEETAYLLRNPTNAKRLLAATEQLNTGKGKARKLVE